MATSTIIPRFLVISLGNPGAAYKDTFHSAGHTVLNYLQTNLASDPNYQQAPWATERIGKRKGLHSKGTPYHFAQSPTLMNVCGPWVMNTYRGTLQERGLSPSELSLVLVHDELELDMGAVKTIPWTRSPRGHNGVKDCHKFMKLPIEGAENRWHRICVGIGRPESRDPLEVSDYVLRRMSADEKKIMEGGATPRVLEALQELEARWTKEHEDAQRPTGKL